MAHELKAVLDAIEAFRDEFREFRDSTNHEFKIVKRKLDSLATQSMSPKQKQQWEKTGETGEEMPALDRAAKKRE